MRERVTTHRTLSTSMANEKKAATEYKLYVAAKNNGDTESQNKHYKEYLNYKEAAK